MCKDKIKPMKWSKTFSFQIKQKTNWSEKTEEKMFQVDVKHIPSSLFSYNFSFHLETNLGGDCPLGMLGWNRLYTAVDFWFQSLANSMNFMAFIVTIFSEIVILHS